MIGPPPSSGPPLSSDSEPRTGRQIASDLRAGPGRRSAPEPAAEALARLYDLDVSEGVHDLDLYLALAARTGGPILELAVGSGRLAVPLAAAGHAVTGVDLDAAMLARARLAARDAGEAVAQRLDLVEGDARTVRLSGAGRYQLALLAFNSLFLMPTRADQAAVILTLAAHLAPGGVAVVDAWLPDADDLSAYDGRQMLEWVRDDPTTGRTVTKTGSAVYDAATGIIRLTTIFDDGLPGEAPVRWVRVDRLRLAGPDDIVAHVEAAGLELETLAGDHDLRPLAPGADRVVVVARRPG